MIAIEWGKAVSGFMIYTVYIINIIYMLNILYIIYTANKT